MQQTRRMSDISSTPVCEKTSHLDSVRSLFSGSTTRRQVVASLAKGMGAFFLGSVFLSGRASIAQERTVSGRG